MSKALSSLTFSRDILCQLPLVQTLVRFLVARGLQSRFESAKYSLDILFQKRLFLAHVSTYLLHYLESSVPEAF